MVWVGDFVHAGAKYEEANTRLHFYVDSSAAPRARDRTFRCELGERGGLNEEDEDSSATYEHAEDKSEEDDSDASDE
jgi:hypothetical protein